MPLATLHRHARVGLAATATLLASAALAAAAPPTNDDPANATSIGTLPYTDSADVTEATSSGDDISRCGMPSNTVWYRFQPAAALRLEASAQGNDGTYTMLIVYAGVTNRNGEVACAANTPIGGAQVSFSAAAGVVYYFAVGSQTFAPGGTASRIAFSLAAGPPPPPNDEIDNARTITSLPFSDSVDTRFATTSADDPDCFGRNATVWYSITPTRDVRLQIDSLGSSYGTIISVYTGTRGSLSTTVCQFPGPTTPGSRVRFAAQAGTTYWVMVADPYGSGGQLQLSAGEAPPPPDNDEIDHARAITGIPFSDSLDTTDATTAGDDPFCFGQGPTVWYSFTSPSDVRVELNTYGSAYGATLSVYTGTRSALSNVACNAYSPGPGARVRFDAAANVTYYVMVGSAYGGPGGLLQLSAVLAPPPFTFDLQLDARDAVDMATGVATVRGTAVCSQPAFVYVSGGLTQARPGQTIDAPFWAGFPCDGITLWSAPVSYTPRLFRGRSVALFVGGKATAAVSGTAYSSSEGESLSDWDMQNVTLTGAKKP